MDYIATLGDEQECVGFSVFVLPLVSLRWGAEEVWSLNPQIGTEERLILEKELERGA